MADNFGPITPPEPQEPEGGQHPIDDRLRQLARETEPLVVLAGAKAARRRGEARRARRRTGALSFVLAAALAVGFWQLLPRLGTDSAQALPSSSSTPPAGSPTAEASADLTARLTAALLPPDALKGATGKFWRSVPPSASAKYTDVCLVRPASGVTASASRTYSSIPGFSSHYYVYAFTSDAAALEEEQAIRTEAAAKCSLSRNSRVDWLPGKAPTPPGLETWGSTKKGFQVSVWLGQRGRYLSVLVLDTSGTSGNARENYYYVAPPLSQCIKVSMDHLASGTAPGHGATPDTTTAPVPGSGGGTATPPAGKGTNPNQTTC